MNTHVRKFVNSFTVSLAVVCAMYVALLLGTMLALNHEQPLHLNDIKIGRIWLPTNYGPDDGYEVAANAILRDLRTEMLFGHIGKSALDVLAVMGVICLALQLTVRVADRRSRRLQLAAPRKQKSRSQSVPSQHATMRRPLGKAAPYGETRHSGPAKVLSFPKR